MYRFHAPSTNNPKLQPLVDAAEDPDPVRAYVDARAAMVVAFKSSTEAALVATEAFIPYGLSMAAAYDSLSEEQRGRIEVAYLWSSFLEPKLPNGEPPAPLSHRSPHYDIAMAMISYAVLTHNAASEKLELLAEGSEGNGELWKAASQGMCQAAGIFEYVRDNLVSKIQSTTRLPPELDVPVLTRLSNVCMSQAGEGTLRVALTKNMSRPLCAKIALFVAASFVDCADGFSVGLGEGTLAAELTNFLRVKHAQLAALAMLFLAESSKSAGQHGEACGYILAASRHMETVSTLVPEVDGNADTISYLTFGLITTVGLSDALKGLVGQLRSEKETILSARAEYESDNDNVYYETVPAEELLEIPDSKAVGKVADYNPPELLFTEITLKDMSGSCSIM